MAFSHPLCFRRRLIVSSAAFLACVGSVRAAAPDTPYDQAVFPTTHNSFCHSPDFWFPNHHLDIATQLDIGVRALMLDVYLQSGQVVVYHGTPLIGSEPLQNILDGEIRPFLQANPDEIVTLMLECYVSNDRIAAEIQTAGLSGHLHTQPPGAAWPTLRDMVDAGGRLVVFSDENTGTQYDWYHYVWDYCVETEFSVHDLHDLDSTFNRGDPENDLFIVNHFVTDASIGVAVEAEARKVNANPFALDRMLTAWRETSKRPNFPTVDFVSHGHLFEASDILNRITSAEAADGMLDRYALDGSTEDASAIGAQHGTPLGGVSFVSDPEMGWVASFDGTDDEIELRSGSVSGAVLPVRAMTVSAWVKPRAFDEWGGYAGLVLDTGSTENGWVLGTRFDHFSFALKSEGNASLTYLQAPAPATANTWQHIAGTYDGTAMTLFVDGAAVAGSSAQSGFVDYPESGWCVLGAYHDDNEFFPYDGLLADVRIHNRALDATEIAGLFAATAVESLTHPSVQIAGGPGFPNPFRHETNIRFSLPEGGSRASLRIHNSAGRWVRTLLDGPVSAGTHTVRWDGRDHTGRPVAAGVYFYRMETDLGPATGKLVRVR